jgi:hypothetical protein
MRRVLTWVIGNPRDQLGLNRIPSALSFPVMQPHTHLPFVAQIVVSDNGSKVEHYRITTRTGSYYSTKSTLIPRPSPSSSVHGILGPSSDQMLKHSSRACANRDLLPIPIILPGMRWAKHISVGGIGFLIVLILWLSALLVSREN